MTSDPDSSNDADVSLPVFDLALDRVLTNDASLDFLGVTDCPDIAAEPLEIDGFDRPRLPRPTTGDVIDTGAERLSYGLD